MLDTFTLWLQACGRRPIPTDRISRTVQHYFNHCGERSPFEREAVISYLAASSLTVKRITLRNRYDHLKVFFRYAVSECLTNNDPLAGLKRPHVSEDETERDVAPVTLATLQSLIQVCPEWTENGLRDRAILGCLWDTPLRASELCGLLVTDIDWETLELRVRDGKGGSQYETAFTPDTGLAIRRYLRKRVDDGPMLFDMTPHGLEQMLRRISNRAGVKPHVFPHQFRHTFRARMRALGLDDADISALMGHRSVRVTHKYARKAARELAKARLRERLA